ncbi:MAG: phosphopantetheine-binding protein, partial [Candidatus Xenobia bacterium]
GMLAVTGNVAEVERLLPSDVTVANRNSPTQVVVSGPTAALEGAANRLREAGLTVHPLPVGGAFHSPLMAPASEQFRAVLADVGFAAGRLPVYSNVTARPYQDDVMLLAEQVVRPVDFAGQIENMYAAGARIFVEVGPGTVLTGLVAAILGSRPHHALALDASRGRQGGLADLARLLAQLAALGVEVRPAAWEAEEPPARPKRMEVSLVGANYRSPERKTERPPVTSVAMPPAAPTMPTTVAAMPPATPTMPTTVAAMPPAAAPQSVSTAPLVSVAPASSSLLRQAFESVQSSLAAMTTLQQQTAQAHQRFLETQEAAQRTLQQVLEGQQRLVAAMMGGGTVPVSLPAPAPPPPAPPPVPTNGVHHATAPVLSTNGTHVAPAPTNGHVHEVAPPPAGDQVERAILQAVADKTGYPVEVLTVDMDLESELGIDSIKRVEILAAVEERLPGAVKVSSDRLGALRTLRQVMEAMRPATAVPAPPAPRSNGASQGRAEETLLTVVAEKTGYPREVLSLDMDLESDLGIDSIKRVEILATLEERLPGLPRLETGRVASLRTLRQVIAAFQGAPAPVAPPPPPLTRRVLHAVEAPPVGEGKLPIAPGFGVRIVGTDKALTKALKAALKLPSGEPERVGGVIFLGTAPREAFRISAQLASSLREAAQQGGALLATISRMDGRFGLTGSDFDPLQGALAGLPKTAAHEWPGVRCKALDVAASWNDSKAVAAAIARELAQAGPLEVGLEAERRWVLQAPPEAVQSGPLPVSSDDVVVITGGARGVAAAVAVALAQQARPRLVLLGRSPAPIEEPAWLPAGEAEMKRALLEHTPHATPAVLEREYRRWAANREVTETLKRITATGASARYEMVDVRDAAALRATLDRVRASAGPIKMLVHAAGVLADRKLEDKTEEQFD